MVTRSGIGPNVLCGLLPSLLPVLPADGQHRPMVPHVVHPDAMEAHLAAVGGWDSVRAWPRADLDKMHRALRAASRDSMYSSHPEPCESVKSGGVGFMAGSMLTDQRQFRLGSVDFYVFKGYIDNPFKPRPAGMYLQFAWPDTSRVYAHVIVINRWVGTNFLRNPWFETVVHELAHYAGFDHGPRDGVPLDAYGAESCFERDEEEEERLKRKDRNRGGGGIPFGWWVDTGGGYGNTGEGLSCRLTAGNVRYCRKTYLSRNPPFPPGHPAYENGIFWNGTWYEWNGSEFEATICHDRSVWVKICSAS